MKRTARSLIALAIVSVLTLGLTTFALGRVSTSSSSKVAIPSFTAAELNALPGANWIVAAGNLGAQRHSSLTQINTSNVAGMQLAWQAPIKAPNPGDPFIAHGGESSQIAWNGNLYTEDQYGRVFANDGATGHQLWYYEPNIDTTAAAKGVYIGGAPRGTAIGDGKVFIEEEESEVVALDQNTGRQIWATVVADVNLGAELSQAPVYYTDAAHPNGMILGATSGGDRVFSCIVFALDARTGKVLWHFNIIPTNPSQKPGYSTWRHPLAYNGGGAVWSNVAVNSAAGLVYADTGNPVPYAGVLRGPGAEWYTTGILALHVDTGKYAWFFQDVHHDLWDADQAQGSVLFDLQYNGKMRHAIYTANKDGLDYVLDSVTGKPIIPVSEVPVQQSTDAFSYPTQPISDGDPLVPQCVPSAAAWAGLTAPDGQPWNVGDGGRGCSFTAMDSKRYSLTAAFGKGAASQRPASYDPKTGYLFNEASPGFSAYKAIPASEAVGLQPGRQTGVSGYLSASLAGTPAAALSGSSLIAKDMRTNKKVWEIVNYASANVTGQPSNAFLGGTMTTDSGLLFTTSLNRLQAYDSSNGKLLWQSPARPGISQSLPMTYMVNGKQYVASYCSVNDGDLYVYALP